MLVQEYLTRREGAWDAIRSFAAKNGADLVVITVQVHVDLC